MTARRTLPLLHDMFDISALGVGADRVDHDRTDELAALDTLVTITVG